MSARAYEEEPEVIRFHRDQVIMAYVEEAAGGQSGDGLVAAVALALEEGFDNVTISRWVSKAEAIVAETQ